MLTGVFVSAWIFNRGSGLPEDTPLGQLASGRRAQIGVQAWRPRCAAGYSFVRDIGARKGIDILWGFTPQRQGGERRAGSKPARRSGLRPGAGRGAGSGDGGAPRTAAGRASAQRPAAVHRRRRVAGAGQVDARLVGDVSGRLEAAAGVPGRLPVRDDRSRRPFPLPRRRPGGDARATWNGCSGDRLGGAGPCATSSAESTKY